MWTRSVWSPDPYVGDQGSFVLTILTLAFIWGVNQCMEEPSFSFFLYLPLSLCNSVCQVNNKSLKIYIFILYAGIGNIRFVLAGFFAKGMWNFLW